MSNREQIVWAAGLFEGEGSVSFRRLEKRAHRISCVMQLSSTDEDVVSRFADCVGCGRVTGPYRNRQWWHGEKVEVGKPYWSWKCQACGAVYALLAKFYPFLGERRQKRAREVMDELTPLSPQAIHRAMLRYWKEPRHVRENPKSGSSVSQSAAYA